MSSRVKAPRDICLPGFSGVAATLQEVGSLAVRHQGRNGRTGLPEERWGVAKFAEHIRELTENR